MDIIGLMLSILPLIVVFLGIVWLKKSGTVMVLVGLALTALICWAYFKTDPVIILGGIIYGIVKSFGISVAVVFAMFMVFLMQLTGSLNRISDAVHNIAGTKAEKALFVGMGFGSFVTALGLVAPTLFPPLLVAMGFTPLAAISIACLGYDPLCSFALLSLPITAPISAANAHGHRDHGEVIRHEHRDLPPGNKRGIRVRYSMGGRQDGGDQAVLVPGAHVGARDLAFGPSPHILGPRAHQHRGRRRRGVIDGIVVYI